LTVASPAHPQEDSLTSRDAVMQASLRPEQDPSVSHPIQICSWLCTNDCQSQQSRLGFFENAQNTLIAGGSFTIVSRSVLLIASVILALIYAQNNFPANARGAQIPVTQMPNSSPFFTGRRDVLDKLEKIFTHQATSRHSCLLWGMGGIGKTQICLKFIEGMSNK
jgi:hypothetical protein